MTNAILRAFCAIGLIYGSMAAGEMTARAEGALTKVAIAQSSVALSFGAMAVAVDQGFFQKEGIEPDVQIMSGGDVTVLTALRTGAVQFAAMTMIPALQAATRGESLRLVSPLTQRFALQIVMNPDAARKYGIVDGMSMKEKFERVKGIGIGTLDIGGGFHLIFKSMAREYGIDADLAYNITAIKSYAGLLAATNRGDVGLALTAIPFGTIGVQKEGLKFFADLWSGDFDQFDGLYHLGLVTTAQVAQANPDTVARVHRALDGALKFMHEHPEEAAAKMHKRYPNLSDDILQLFLVRDHRSFAADGRFGHRGFDLVRDFVAKGLIAKASELKYDDLVLPIARVP
jgi:NitT/TauT family transport system substrate-binding protein